MAYLKPQTLSGCTCNYTEMQEIMRGTYIEDLQLTVQDGYQFPDDGSKIQLGPWQGYEASVRWYTDKNKSYMVSRSNPASKAKSLYAGRFGFTSGNDIALRCACDAVQPQPVAPQCGLTPQVLSNCTCNISPDDKYDKDSTIYITITSNEGYSWWYVASNVMVNTRGLDSWSWYIDESRTTRVTASNIRGVTKLYTQLSFTSGNNVKLTATASKVNLIQTLAFCTSDFPVNPLPGDSVTLTLTADSGYVFKSAPTADVPDGRGGSRRLTATIAEDARTAAFVAFQIYNTAQQYVITGTAEPDASLSDIYPFISVYAPTDEQLKELSKKRFYKISGGTGETVDLGQYIINLIKVYAPVKTGLPATIKLWDYDTQVISNIVTEQQITADLGTATVINPLNASELRATKLSIYLPFLGTQDLDAQVFLTAGPTPGQIKCLYHIDVLTGDCTIELTDGQGYTIYVFECNVSIQIPYIISNYNIAYRGDVKTNSKAFISKVPYLLYQRPSQTFYGTHYKAASASVIPEDIIDNTLAGNHVTYRFAAPKDDLDEITQIFSQGVHIPTKAQITELTQ